MESRLGLGGSNCLCALLGGLSCTRYSGHIAFFHNARCELGPVKPAHKEGNHEPQVRHQSGITQVYDEQKRGGTLCRDLTSLPSSFRVTISVKQQQLSPIMSSLCRLRREPLLASSCSIYRQARRTGARNRSSCTRP